MKSLADTLAGVFSSPALLPAGAGDSAPRCRPARRKGTRRLEIEAEEQAALARAFAYATAQARRLNRPQAEVDALEREYAQRIEAGPDFTHYRRRSDFGPPPRHGLDGNAIARLRYRFNSMARQSWEQRRAGKHRGLISRTCKDVFAALLLLAERHKALFPSLLCIARLAQCCKQSVVTALAVLERLGFITRHRRLRKADSLLGPKTEQDTNAYELHEPRTGRGELAWLLFSQPKAESKNPSATAIAVLSYLMAHPETWGSPGIARCDAYGGPPEAAHF